MSNGKTIGMILFVGGIILLIAYGLYLGFEELLEALDFLSGFFLGLILVGLVVLIVSIVIEQRRDTKKMMNEIEKEELEP
jgi:SNF family Na+-dependent transporter